MLTKVLMVGKANDPVTNTTVILTDFFFINCPNHQKLSLPNDYMSNPSKLYINLGEDVVHATILNNSTSLPEADVVYYVDQNTVAIMAFYQAIVIPANTQWIRS